MSKKKCKNCGDEFDPADRVDGNVMPAGLYETSLNRTVFCSEQCKKQYDNKRYYIRHAAKIIDRVKRSKK